MMARRRSQLDIYADILNAVSDKACKTHIVYKANLNFNRCRRYMDDLRGGGLIRIETHSPPTWVITEKGRKFLKTCKELKGFLEL